MPKASYNVNASAPYPTGVRAKKLPGSKDQGDSTNPRQGSSVSSDYEDDVKPRATVSNAGAGAGGEGRRPQGSSTISQPPQVTSEDLDFSDDVEALFEGSDLTEEFKEKALLVFETAVATKVNEVVAEYTETLQEEFEEARQEVAEDLVLKLDQYLDYVIEQWLEDNELAVESGIKNEISESLLTGLRDLFNENYVQVPEGKEDLLADLASRVDQLEDELNETIEDNVELRSQVKDYEKAMVFAEVTEGLTETQVAKLESLAESMNFDDSDEFKEKLETLCESYFPGTAPTRGSFDDEDPVELNEDTQKRTDPRMKAYTSAISRTVKK